MDTASSETSAERQKLCVVAFCSPANMVGEEECNICIVDLDSRGKDGFSSRIRLSPECFPAEGFCMLGSSLFIFAGCDRYASGSERERRKSVCTLDLSTAQGLGDFNLEKGMLRSVHDMQHAKVNTVAIPMPDGERILVFSTLIEAQSTDEGDFEIYNPEGGSSEVLPALYFRDSHIWIEAYSFVRESRLLVQTGMGKGRMFLLDLESVDKGWQRLPGFGGAARIPMSCAGPFFVFEDRFCFTPVAAYDMEKPYGLGMHYLFPSPPFPKGQLARSFITLVGNGYDKESGECNFCVFRIGILQDKEECGYIKINLCRSRLEEYKVARVAAAEPFPFVPINTDLIKTLKFRVDNVERTCFSPVCVFSF